jgi:hypothetical protein
MSNIDVAARGWKVVGETQNSRFFESEPGILVALPLPGAVDDQKTALANRAFQEEYCRKSKRGIVIVLVDGFVAQDGAARRIYQESSDPAVVGVGLVASSLLGRAIAAFSIGIRRATLPVKMFGTLEEALEWGRTYPGIALAQKDP